MGSVYNNMRVYIRKDGSEAIISSRMRIGCDYRLIISGATRVYIIGALFICANVIICARVAVKSL